MAPFYTVKVRGHCDSDVLTHLSVTITLENPAALKDGSICRLDNFNGNVPSYKHDSSSIRAWDSHGPLRITLHTVQAKSVSEWTVDRNTIGNVTFVLQVYPREVDSMTPLGPRVDLRRDGRGLIGGGSWFLPSPTYSEYFTFCIGWDLDHCPTGTQGIWSYGDSNGPCVESGPIGLLLNSVFMMGPINTLIPMMPQGTSSLKCGIYWFGDLPTWIQQPASAHGTLLAFASKIFSDDDLFYKVFIRRAPRGFGGYNFSSSYILEYSEPDEPKEDSELICLFAHEMVHNWVYLGHEDDGFENSWFIEGNDDLIYTELQQKLTRQRHRSLLRSFHAP